MPSSPLDPSVETALVQCYAAARLQAGPGVGIAALHIGAEQSGFAVGSGATPALLKWLPLGAERTAREHFRTEPPTPLAMENAIATVEDAVMPLHKVIPSGAQLFGRDAALQEIARLSGLPEGPERVLSLEAMERTFDRLASVVLGSPAAHSGLPTSRQFAATLLILREWMHHLRFAEIQVLGD